MQFIYSICSMLFLASGLMQATSALASAGSVAQYPHLAEAIEQLLSEAEGLGWDAGSVHRIGLHPSELDDDSSYQLVLEKELTASRSRTSRFTGRTTAGVRRLLRVTAVYDAESDQVQVKGREIQQAETTSKNTYGNSRNVHEQWSSTTSGTGDSEDDLGALHLFTESPSRFVYLYHSKTESLAATEGKKVQSGKVEGRSFYFAVIR